MIDTGRNHEIDSKLNKINRSLSRGEGAATVSARINSRDATPIK